MVQTHLIPSLSLARSLPLSLLLDFHVPMKQHTSVILSLIKPRHSSQRLLCCPHGIKPSGTRSSCYGSYPWSSTGVANVVPVGCGVNRLKVPLDISSCLSWSTALLNNAFS